MDEAFLLQRQEVSCLRALLLMEDFNHPDICWDSGMVGGRQSRRFLESVQDNSPWDVVDAPSMEVFKVGLTGDLGSLIFWFGNAAYGRELELDELQGHSQPK